MNNIRLVLWILIVVVLCFMSWSFADNKHPNHRLLDKKEVQEQYNIRAVELITKGLQHAAFAAQLDCSCYDIIMSSTDAGQIIKINKDRCQ